MDNFCFLILIRTIEKNRTSLTFLFEFYLGNIRLQEMMEQMAAQRDGKVCATDDRLVDQSISGIRYP